MTDSVTDRHDKKLDKMEKVMSKPQLSRDNWKGEHTTIDETDNVKEGENVYTEHQNR